MPSIDLDFGVFYPKQTQFLNLVNSSPATTLGYGGSRGGMKSHTVRRIILMRRFQFKGTKACILRRTYDLVRENHIDKMLAEFTALRDWYHIGDKELRLPNGSAIAFRYAENPGDVDAMIGKEYMDFFVDQGEVFTESEHNVMKSCTRWPGVNPSQCKYIVTFNPGNIGHAYLQRIFYDKKFNSREREQDYAFLHAFGWDNPEWSRTELERDGLTIEDYFKWNDDQRFQYFITRSQYGRELNALPEAMRIGWLMGRMDQFAGQYFDIFSFERHVVRCHPQPWMSRWIGIDWGFAHNASAHWLSQIKENLMGVYREFLAKGRSPKALAQEIVDKTPIEERKFIMGIGLSHDAFAKRDERDSAAIQMGEIFTANGMPHPRPAGKDVIGTAARIYELFRSNEIVIDPSCANLTQVIPMITRDKDNPERTIKFDGDDAFDSLKHALQVRQPMDEMPMQNRVLEHAKTIQDPFSRWFYLTKRLKKHESPVVANPPMSVFEREARNGFY